MTPRVLFVGRSRLSLPLEPGLGRKWDALGEAMELRVLARARERNGSGDERFVLTAPLRPRRLDGAAFYAMLPIRVARELRRFRPDAVVAQGPYEAAAALVARRLARSRVRLVVELHGDWRTATRLYGSPLRRLLQPVADHAADAAVRRADVVRAISGYTTGLLGPLGVEPAAVFPAYVDLAAFADRPPEPLPERPRALFVGVLERYKGVDVLAAAWRLAAPRVPEASLLLVGDGPQADVAERLVAEAPGRVEWTHRLTPVDVARALDGSSLLVLASRSEGLPRIVIEAFCRARPVVGTRAGGIPDIVDDGVSGLLVPPDDPVALAGALVSALGDRTLLERLAAGARAAAAPWLQTPEEFAARTRELVEHALA